MDGQAVAEAEGGHDRLGPAAPLAIDSRTVGLALGATSVLLTVASFAMHAFVRATDRDTIALFDVGDEVSVATWFGTLQFSVAAVVLLLGGRTHRTTSGRWRGLAIIMVLLSIDEAASMHERGGSALRDLSGAGGYLYYVWVIPALVFTAAVGLYALVWLRSLPSRTAVLVMAAGAIFVLGAAGLEILAGPEAEARGTATTLSIVLSGVEELMEMLGLSLFIYAILDHLSGRTIPVAVDPNR